MPFYLEIDRDGNERLADLLDDWTQNRVFSCYNYAGGPVLFFKLTENEATDYKSRGQLDLF